MKRKSAVLLLFVLVLFAVPGAYAFEASDTGPSLSIRKAPKAPVFTTAERQAELKARRAKVAAAMADNSILVMLSADPKLYTNDVDYVYRQENNLFYLTGINQDGISLVISKSGGKITEHLFLPKRDPRYETWNGRMLANEEAAEISGIPNVIDSDKFTDFLTALKAKNAFAPVTDGSETKVYLIKGNSREFGKENKLGDEIGGREVVDAAPIFGRLRLVKSPYELKLLQHAIDITIEAIGRSMGMVGRADWEYEVQAEVEYTFRRRNADFWGYPSIVGCGPNATTLHYVESQGKVSPGSLLLMDVGAEYQHYTADITRTFPVSGRFTKEQAEIYQVVYDAQEAAAATMKPGSQFGEASRAAARTIEEGLAKLGLITAVGATYDAEINGQTFKRPQYTLWYMHGWGHWLGMNVHDVGPYGTFAEGMVTTNEPGIYIRGDALDYLPDTPANKELKSAIKSKFEAYKNIGVRIEDDMLVTKDGVEWMTKALPRSIKDVEAFMAAAAKEMKGYAGVERMIEEAVASRRAIVR